MVPVEADINYGAYKRDLADPELSAELQEMFVAYVDGVRVFKDVSREVLEVLLTSEYPDRPKFVTQFGVQQEADVPMPFL